MHEWHGLHGRDKHHEDNDREELGRDDPVLNAVVCDDKRNESLSASQTRTGAARPRAYYVGEKAGPAAEGR